jgi:photosystem II stability/assembly factor-like uncharacterized protein
MLTKSFYTCVFMFLAVHCFGQFQWQPVGPLFGGRVQCMAVDSQGRMYASASGRLYFSDNNGDEWDRIPGLYALSMYVDQTDQLFMISDQGRLWKLAGAGGPELVTEMTTFLRIIGLSDGTLIGLKTADFFSTQVVRSNDHGATWTELYNFENYVFWNNMFFADEQDRLYLGTDYGFFRSDDGGSTFTDKNEGVVDTGIGIPYNVVSAIADHGGNLYRLTQGMVYRSADNGDTWQSAHYNLPSQDWSFGFMNVDNAGNVYFLNDAGLTFYVLPPGSSVWQELPGVGASHFALEFNYNRVTDTFFFPAFNAGIIRYSKSDQQWTFSDSGITSVTVNALMKNSGGDLLVLAGSGYYFQSDSTWNRDYFFATNQKDGNEYGGNFVEWQGKILTMTRGGFIQTSHDGGHTWASHETGLRSFVDLVQAGDDLYYIGLDFNRDKTILYKSLDGGQTWNQVSENLVWDGIRYPDILTYGGDQIFYIHIWESSMTTTRVEKIDLLNESVSTISQRGFGSLAVSPTKTLFGVTPDSTGNSLLMRYQAVTNDWIPIFALPNSYYKLSFLKNGYMFLSGGGGKLYYSPDEGTTMIDISNPEVSAIQPAAPFLDDENYLYVGVSGRGVYKSAAALPAANPMADVYVLIPRDGTQRLPLMVPVVAKQVPGANTYTIELNTAPDFSGIAKLQSGGFAQRFTNLSSATTYYTRVKTNLSAAWGRVTTFSTRLDVMSPGIYPNPFKDNLVVIANADDATIIPQVSLHDMRGLLLLSKKAEDGEAVFDTSRLPEGLYLVKVLTRDGTKTFTVVKK